MSHASPPGADAPAWTPSQVEVDRRRFRQRRTARSAGLSALSTLAVLGVLTALLVAFAVNRSVIVTTGAVTTALRDVYGMQRLVEELGVR